MKLFVRPYVKLYVKAYDDVDPSNNNSSMFK